MGMVYQVDFLDEVDGMPLARVRFFCSILAS